MYGRGLVKERVYGRRVNDINELKGGIRDVTSTIPREMCIRALNATVNHCFLCVEHDGVQVETIIYIIYHF